MNRQRHELTAGALFVALLGLTAALYRPGLAGGLILDDFANFEPFTAVEAGKLTWEQAISDNQAGPLGRPVAMASFAVNWAASGGSVWELKYANLMLHLLVGALVFWLTGRLLAHPGVGVASHRWWLALWVCAAWLLAPLSVSTVLYVVQRMTQLSALFVLGGLLCYVIGRQNLEKRFSAGAALIVCAFVVFWPLAVLSKENGALLPLYAFVVELFWFGFSGTRAARRFLTSIFAVVLLVPAVSAGVWLLADSERMVAGYRARDFTLGERLLTEPRALLDYAGQLLLPRGAAMGVYHDDYIKSEGLLAPPTTLVAILVWGLVLGLAWWGRNTRLRWVAFGPCFFLAAHALESTVFPLELYFEHRNYLAAYGLFFSLGLGAWYLLQRLPARRQLAAVVLVLLPVGYATACYQRIMVWRTPETLLLSSAEAHPRSARAHSELASLYANARLLDRALAELAQTEALYPEERSSGVALHRLLVYCVVGTSPPDAAYARLEALARFDDDNYSVNALEQVSEKLETGRCGELDVPRLAQAVHRLLENSPTNALSRRWKLHIYAGKLLARAERKDAALAHLRMAERLLPKRLIASLLSVPLLLEKGDIDGARDTLARLRARDQGKVMAHTRMIAAYERLLEIVAATEARIAEDSARPNEEP